MPSTDPARHRRFIASLAGTAVLLLVTARDRGGAHRGGPQPTRPHPRGPGRVAGGDLRPRPDGANFLPPGVVNGVTFPTPSQPAIGFSGIVDGRSPGEYLAMPDNGYGNKLNSFDFELRAYYITPDFKTAKGGTGGVGGRRLHRLP